MSPIAEIRASVLRYAEERQLRTYSPALSLFIDYLRDGRPVIVETGILRAARIDFNLLQMAGFRLFGDDPFAPDAPKQPLWQLDTAELFPVEINWKAASETPIVDRHVGWRVWKVTDDGALVPPFVVRTFSTHRRGLLYTATCEYHDLDEIPAAECLCGIHSVTNWASFWPGVEVNILQQLLLRDEDAVLRLIITYGRAEGRIALDSQQRVWDSARSTRYRILGALVPRGIEHLLPKSFDVPLRRMDWSASPDEIKRASTMLVDQIALQQGAP